MAIQGIGVDIVEVDRIEEMIGQWRERFLRRIFTPEEIAICSRKARPAVSYAARFAAKEAFSKAMGTGLGGELSWQDFSVGNLASGQPVAVLSPRLEKKLRPGQVLLSLSHSEKYAIAMVIIVDE
ncbi:MAG: holo-[acyl-carrier-protein] synthase [Calditrichaeota bacterium]|nr:MAG: holo-[acyl-carrier-protein] synthase [Calditrichota bacterium]